MRNFLKLQLLIFFCSSKKKTSYLWGGGPAGKLSRYVMQLTCKQTRKMYENSHRPVCQYTAPCVIIGLKAIAIDKHNYMIILF